MFFFSRFSRNSEAFVSDLVGNLKDMSTGCSFESCRNNSIDYVIITTNISGFNPLATGSYCDNFYAVISLLTTMSKKRTFRVILRHPLQNYWKILKKCFLRTICIVMISACSTTH